MNAIQQEMVKTQLWQDIGLIADSDLLMQRLAKYVSRLVRERRDETAMSKDEFMDKIERGERAYKMGQCSRLRPNETVTEMLRRNGYDV